MTPDKLKKNLENLRYNITRKPPTYSDEYAKTINESFTKYTRTRTVNLILSVNEILLEYKWPFPAYNLGNQLAFAKLIVVASPIVLKMHIVKYLNTIIGNKKPCNLSEQEIQPYLDQLMSRHFYLCKRQIFSSWKTNPIFLNKHKIIDDIHKTYTKKYWYACIISALPLLDLVCRKFFNTRKLDKDITALIAIFREAGVFAKDVKPGYIAWEIAIENGSDASKAKESDLRLVGIALGSFLDFADIYYAYFRKTQSGSNDVLNRHAIIHCAVDDIWTQENATRILIFLDLALHLEPVFDILLKEN